jgi:hypothetical protein
MSFSQNTKDTINGWGSVLRFITPILITIAIFILTGIKDEIKFVKDETIKRFDKIDLQFSNHLGHHLSLETLLAERMASIEARIRNPR